MAISDNILAGDYMGGVFFIDRKKGLYISIKKFLQKPQITYINKTTVESYEVVHEQGGKSVSSGIVKGAVGGALFGGIGAVAGASSGKSSGVYTVSINFKDGTRCLCDLCEATYKTLLTTMY